MDSSAFVTAFFSGIIQHLKHRKITKNIIMSVVILPRVTDRNISNFIAVLRAGYLTLFERGDNTAAVYTEFRKFDSLLTKLARGTIRRGKLHEE